MGKESASFEIGLDFKHVLAAISKQIYETPLAFLRENVQNAVDAIRIQAVRSNTRPSDNQYEIAVEITNHDVIIRDNGIGMSGDDLRDFFWTIGASGKRNEEAKAAGCVGMFGIGGFANLGVCDKLTVISQTEGAAAGTQTSLSESDIEKSVGGLPQVLRKECNEAAPRGTIVIGHHRQAPNPDELQKYLSEFVAFAAERITFNGRLLSQQPLFSLQSRGLTLCNKDVTAWTQGDVEVKMTLYQDEGKTVHAELLGLAKGDVEHRLSGAVRFEGGALDIFKRGFKICATKIQTHIGVSGQLDCDLLSPTAGRDSLDAPSQALATSIVACLEAAAIRQVLSSSQLIAQHTRIFQYIARHGLYDSMDKTSVRLADGSDALLSDLALRSERGIKVFFGETQMEALSQIMQARGHVVVVLPADRHKRRAVEHFLSTKCKAQALSGIVEASEVYEDLSRFERVFLSELERTIRESYEVSDFHLTASKLTEDIPVYLLESKASRGPQIYVDTRHGEITKLESLGFSPLMYSLVATFCTEYLGAALRKKSPKFFGSGAINLDSLSRKRSDIWVLLKDDIHTVSKRSQRHVVRRSDVHTVNAGGPRGATDDAPHVGGRRPKLLRIEGDEAFANIIGYYIRIPDGAATAYGDVIRECDSRGAVWAGNKILLVASDAISTAFQFEIRMDHLIVVSNEDGGSVEGAAELSPAVQALEGGLYFPIPKQLESILVPEGDEEIRIEVSSGDWIDLKTATAWESKEA